MGRGFSLHCTRCGFQETAYLGVGFAYPEVYEQTKRAAQKGKFGKRLRKTLAEHPDAAIDPSYVLTCCPNCKKLGSGSDLSVYLPKPDYDPTQKERIPWSMAMPFYEADYVSPSDMQEHYSLFQRFNHRCTNCGQTMELIAEEAVQTSKILCPECGAELSVECNTMWD